MIAIIYQIPENNIARQVETEVELDAIEFNAQLTLAGDQLVTCEMYVHEFPDLHYMWITRFKLADTEDVSEHFQRFVSESHRIHLAGMQRLTEDESPTGYECWCLDFIVNE